MLNSNKKIAIFLRNLKNYLGKAFVSVCVTDITPACVCLNNFVNISNFYIPEVYWKLNIQYSSGMYKKIVKWTLEVVQIH